MEGKNVPERGNKGPGVGRACLLCKRQLLDWCAFSGGDGKRWRGIKEKGEKGREEREGRNGWRSSRGGAGAEGTETKAIWRKGPRN